MHSLQMPLSGMIQMATPMVMETIGNGSEGDSFPDDLREFYNRQIGC